MSFERVQELIPTGSKTQKTQGRNYRPWEMIYNGMAPNLGRATNSNAGAAQLFHCVQHLLAARGDERLKFARFFWLHLAGDLSRLSLELWRFCL